ncbi:MAG TPA: helix-turn-helix domain-containing protein, partial [Gemmatimonadaceae bacterium]
MNRRDEILTAAAGVFAQHGFRGSTTRRIADAAGVNEITLFRQFGSKEALMREAMKHLSQSAGLSSLPKTPGDPETELAGWSESFIQHLRLRSSIIRKTMGEIEERPEMSQCASYVPRQASNDLCLYLTALQEQGKATAEFDPKT